MARFSVDNFKRLAISFGDAVVEFIIISSLSLALTYMMMFWIF